jgi:glyoxylase-like metal-dependent hydrolase (beta-lactamase superfamily II)
MLIKFLVAFAVMLAAACGSEAQQAEAELSQTESKVVLSEPQLEKIANGVWIHKSWNVIEPWGLVLSQGLVVKTDAGVILVDTAWNDMDTEKLLALIEAETGELPKEAIVTHAHSDKMGGMNALHARNIKTIAHTFSNDDAPARGLSPASTGLSLSENMIDAATLREGLTILYPGAGHTRDNIVVYYAPAKILFGGCLIRPGDSGNLGNTTDGDVGHWAEAVRNAAAAFPEAEIVIPSHGAMGGRELLDHTIALAESANGQGGH